MGVIDSHFSEKRKAFGKFLARKYLREVGAYIMRRMAVIDKDKEAALFRAGTQSYFFHWGWKVFKRVRIRSETPLDIVMERYQRKPSNIELLALDSSGNYLFWDRVTCYFVSFELNVFASLRCHG